MHVPSIYSTTLTITQVPQLLNDAAAMLPSDLWQAQRLLVQALEILDEGAAQRKSCGGMAAWQIRRIDEHIRQHLDGRIQSRDLANVVGLSLSHFSHAFRQTFHETPMVYVARKRVALAQQKLLRHRHSLAQIALECGFCDQSHLTRVFNRVTGTSPRIWQALHANGPVMTDVDNPA
ncbi:hypothetical protein RE428_23470 [Marinobacter nanhaiticus D15-8W]|uniref:AraC family transcriptional regulator n=1 Tax=Marinobacter nanhaiticus D15-8W TaxID=626887 RepID=N6WQT5_9GAMM|nr:AraC family transcriptional regulator [Marinobacter nanhaiticus]ENO13951.1 AraC family transcriptional regulator [Marinobacter nanhaiticus D15-8W]BES71329.1 hypothetical protein RE428_23470 [Marinobacter nanhaiticus D15-8W]